MGKKSKKSKRFFGLWTSAPSDPTSSTPESEGSITSKRDSRLGFLDGAFESISSLRSKQSSQNVGTESLRVSSSTTSVRTCPPSIQNVTDSADNDTPVTNISNAAANSPSKPPSPPIRTMELTMRHTEAIIHAQPGPSTAPAIVISIPEDDQKKVLDTQGQEVTDENTKQQISNTEPRHPLLQDNLEQLHSDSVAFDHGVSVGGATPVPSPQVLTLWDKTLEIANKKLLDNNLPLLERDTRNLVQPENNLAEILQELRIAHEDVKKKRWRYKDWRGKEIVVVEMLGKVLGYLDRYAKTVDTAIQHNPDIVALVWGGIRTIMQVTLNHIAAMECLEIALTTVVEKIAICEFYASTYAELSTQQMSETNNQKLQEIVDSALPRLYASVLVFTVKAREYLCPPDGFRSFTNKFKAFVVEIQPFLNESLEAEKRVRECANIALVAREKGTSDRLIRMENILKEFKSELQPLTNLKEILKGMEIIQTRMTKAEEDRILPLLQLLSPLEPLKRHQDIRALRLPNTGAWLVQSESFRKWQNVHNGATHGDGRILCCYGMPGAGKTIISSLVIDHLNTQYDGNATIANAIMYSDYRDQTKQTVVHILGSVLHQYLTSCSPLSRIPQEVIEKLEKIKARNDKVNIENILSMLDSSLQQFGNTFVCIDALDELDPHTRQGLLQVLKNNFGTTTRYFLTGRPHIRDEVRKCLGGINQECEIHLTANPEDIRLYVQHRIEDDEGLNPEAIDQELKQDILSILVQRSQGMFLLPSLHISMILDEMTISQRRKALEKLPSTLYDTFADIVRRIKMQRPQSRASLGMKVLMWLHLAFRPLKLNELQHALSVERDQKEFDKSNITSQRGLLDSCLGLVIVDKETGTIRFVHYTLEEFFRLRGDEYFPDGRPLAAETCLRYLHFRKPCEDIEVMKKELDQFVFLEYAALYWGKYTRLQTNDAVETMIIDLISQTDSCATQILSWLLPRIEHLFRAEPKFSTMFSFLHMAAYFGLERVITMLPESNNWDASDDMGRTPLAWAAVEGHEAVARLLLGRPDVDPDRKDNAEKTPLFYAVENGHEGIVRLLLEQQHLDPNIQDYWETTPLLRAAEKGHEGILRLFLEREDVDPNIQGYRGETPLCYAAENGYEAVVQLLLERQDVDPNIENYFGKTPLFCAAENGHEAVVRLLSECKKVDLQAKDEEGKTACDWAILKGHESIATFLRSLAQDPAGTTAEPLDGSNLSDG